MQSWQLISMLLVGGVFAASFAMRSKLRATAAQLHDGVMPALRAEVVAGRSADESDPICVIATQRSMLSAKVYYVAVTNRRVVIKLAGGETRSFERSAVQMSIARKRFADVGNMQTTYTEGWELIVVLPGNDKNAWRVYAEAYGIPEHGTQVQALVANLAS